VHPPLRVISSRHGIVSQVFGIVIDFILTNGFLIHATLTYKLIFCWLSKNENYIWQFELKSYFLEPELQIIFLFSLRTDGRVVEAVAFSHRSWEPIYMRAYIWEPIIIAYYANNSYITIYRYEGVYIFVSSAIIWVNLKKINLWYLEEKQIKILNNCNWA